MELLLISTLLIIIVCRFLWKRKVYVDAINKLHGPKAFPIIGNIPNFIQHNFEILTFARANWGEFAGSACRIWLGPWPYIILNRVEDVEAVLGSMAYIEKSSDYYVLHPWLGAGLLTSTGAKWRFRRRLLTPAFHFKILEQSMQVFNRNSRLLIQKLRRELPDDSTQVGKSFDISRYISLCALDTICESAMGTSVKAQENVDSDYVNATKVACKTVYLRGVKPWLISNLTFYLSPTGRAFKSALKVLHGMTTSVIKLRRDELIKEGVDSNFNQKDDGTKNRMAFLDQLLLASNSGTPLSDTDIQEEVDTFMFEGHDTTATALSFALYALSVNQDVQDKVYDELYSIFGDSDHETTMKDLQEMKYLERVIKEALRLYPSVPQFLRALHHDLPLVGGQVAPAGCTLIIVPFMMHRDPKYFPDPERFDPDRFLPENSVDRHPYAYFPFSAGPRNCIGQKFAMLEMKSMLSKVLFNYRVLEASPNYQPDVLAEVILKARNGVLVRLQARERPGNVNVLA